MVLYLAFAIPVIAAIALYTFFKHKTKIWEVAVPMLFTIILILGAKAICVSSLTDDTEYWGGMVYEARYYEAWDEYIHQTCTRECCCVRDSKGNETCGTETYDCSYVDYHPEYWQIVTSLGSYNISEEQYNKLVRKFEVRPTFKDMHRDYHSRDGDMYYARWDNSDEKLEPITRPHSYENRPKASSSIYRFEPVDSFDIKQYKPFDYPSINGYKQRLILGYNDPKAEHALQILNARLGKEKQVRVYFLIFKNQPLDAGAIQERYWEGGNKNELNVCIGIDDNNNVKWAYVFSWTEQSEVKVNIRTHIQESKKFDLYEYVNYTKTQVLENWVRKQFKDFDYLTIEPTMKQIIWIYILTILFNAGICVWIVNNEFDDEPRGKYYWK